MRGIGSVLEPGGREQTELASERGDTESSSSSRECVCQTYEQEVLWASAPSIPPDRAAACSVTAPEQVGKQGGELHVWVWGEAAWTGQGYLGLG